MLRPDSPASVMFSLSTILTCFPLSLLPLMGLGLGYILKYET